MDKGFLVFGDIEAVLDEMTDEQVGQLFRGMVSYHNTGTDPGFAGVLKYVFIPIRQQMDRGAELYRAKCEQNRKNRQEAWDRIKGVDEVRPYTTDTNVNVGYLTKTKTDTETKKETDTESSKLDVWSLSRSVLSHLNNTAGTSYRLDAASSVRLISDLAHKGYTEEQMKAVINKKCRQWLGDPKVEQYLRPATLFGPKFDQYLNEPDTALKKTRDEERKRDEDREEARRQLAEKNEELAALGIEYDAAYGDTPKRIDLRGKMAVVQAQVDALTARVGG